SLYRLELQVALEVVQKSDDRRGFLELGFKFGNQSQWLRVQIVQIEHQKSRRLCRVRDSRDGFLLALHKFHFDAQFLRGLLDLCLEEQIIDEAEDASRRIRTHRNIGSTHIDVVVVGT